MAERYDPQEIKRRLSFLDLAAHEGLDARRSGGGTHVAVCPFHQEKSGSFTIYSYANREQDHAHCFGCGWNGDVIAFYQSRRGCDFVSALPPLASLASVPPSVFIEKRFAAQKAAGVTRHANEPKEKPALPRLRHLTNDEIGQLAQLRNLDPIGIIAADAAKRVGGCVWPQWDANRNRTNGTHDWRVTPDAGPCWVVTDQSRRVAQFRRLDSGKFKRRDGTEIKAWTKGSPTWPIGADDMGDRGPVLFVEGGADMLAAFHFLALFYRLGAVAVCAMLGASCAICDEALPFFLRKRVRLIMHNDPAGLESAARWTAQLTAAGAAVESFSLDGLVRRDGEPVSDLNDLALCDESVWLDEELRSAFFDFDF